jgi:uncharacterized protein YgbK (DUF1537 family)
MYQKAAEVFAQLHPDYKDELLSKIRKEFLQEEKTVIVFDDDPTGTQTCHDIVVITNWRVPLLVAELKKKPSILFILTNSRSVPEQKAIALNLEIGKNVNTAAKQSGRKIIAISRSDSTLRGHFPAEVTAISKALQLQEAVWIIVPAFIEGGRFTINDVHYIQELGELVPVSETPFARDRVFGYSHSNIKDWIIEKSKGAVTTDQITSLSLDDIRLGGPDVVGKKLMNSKTGEMIIANAASYKDLEVLAMGVLIAEKSGRQFLYRSSATFVSIRAGIAAGKNFIPLKKDFVSLNGALIVVGSYVPKTTSQLTYLLEKKQHEVIEINVGQLLSGDYRFNEVILQTDRWLAEGKDVILYTSRELKTGSDDESNLKINNTVSAALVDVVSGLITRPSFIIAKGGITSSDIASKGLSAESALILGQAAAGVPVWRLSAQSKFPEILYVVFPGNVGDDAALWNVWDKFKSISKNT